MAAPGCVSEAVEMECGRSEIDELIKEVSRAACPGRHGESGASQVPRLGHRGPRAVTPARMGRVSACTSHSVLRPEGWGPAASASTELPPALDLSGFERFGWHHISPGLFQAGCSGKKPPSTSLAAGGWIHDADYPPVLTRLGPCPVGAAPSPQGAGEPSNQAY